MNRSALLALLPLAVWALAACAPAKPPRAPLTTREGTTVRTSCGETAPALDDSVLEPTAAPIGQRIERICFYGASDANRPDLAKVLTFKVGDNLTKNAVRDSLEAIVKLRFYDDAAIGADIRGTGTVVHVTVHELPVVDEVVFDGDEKLDSSPFAVGGPLDPQAVAAAVRKLREQWVHKGYAEAKIDFAPEATNPGHVRVRCTITPGPIWTIQKTVFLGVAKVQEADLRAAIALPDGSVFDDQRVIAAAYSMFDVYANRGMLNAKIGEPKRDVAVGGGVTLTWTIAEGDVYTVGTLKYGRLGAKLAKELGAVVKTKPKAVLDRSIMIADTQRVQAFFAQRGKAVTVTPQVQIDEKKKTVDVVLDVVEGS